MNPQAARNSPNYPSLTRSNLTNANHAIFLSPLLPVSKLEENARETPPIGRVRRYGQVKHLHIYRFLTIDSVDETIFKGRDGLSRMNRSKDVLKLQI